MEAEKGQESCPGLSNDYTSTWVLFWSHIHCPQETICSKRRTTSLFAPSGPKPPFPTTPTICHEVINRLRKDPATGLPWGRNQSLFPSLWTSMWTSDVWRINCLWKGFSLGNWLFLFPPSLYWHSPLSKMKSRVAQYTGQAGFQDRMLIREQNGAPDFPLGIRSSSYQWQLELATEGLWQPQAKGWGQTSRRTDPPQSHRKPTARTSEPALSAATQVLPDRGSHPSHPGRRDNGEQEGNNAR